MRMREIGHNFTSGLTFDIINELCDRYVTEGGVISTK
jgi:hypothetical protein